MSMRANLMITLLKYSLPLLIPIDFLYLSYQLLKEVSYLPGRFVGLCISLLNSMSALLTFKCKRSHTV